MKKGIVGRILGLVLSAVLVASSGVPSLAAEEFLTLETEDAEIEEFQEEFTVDESEDEFFEEFSEEAEETEFVEEEPAEEFLEEASEEIIEETESDPVKEEQWKSKEYTIVYHNKTGSKDLISLQKYKIEEDKDKALTAPFTKTGYRIAGWSCKYSEDILVDYTVGELAEGIADANGVTKVDLYAQWTQIEYAIVFCDAEGDELDEQPEGHYGYYDSLKYADTVEFSAAATYISSLLPDGTGVVGFSKTLQGKAAYVPGKSYSKLTTVNEDVITLYPVISQDEYSIRYNLEGASLTKPVLSYKSGKKVELPKATKTGYRFLGWEPDEETTVDELEIKEVKDLDGVKRPVAVAIKSTTKANVDLKPVFEPIRFKLYLAPNGKGVTNDGKAFKKKKCLGVFNYEGDAVKTEGYFEPNELARKGYGVCEHLSLNPKATKEEEFISIEDLSGLTTKGSVTIYCIWEKIEHHVWYINEAVVYDTTSKDNEGNYDYDLLPIVEEDKEFVKEESIYFGTSYKLSPSSIPGCTFLGWAEVDPEESGASLSKEKSGKIKKIKADNESDVIVRGYFVENSFKLKVNPNGGTVYDADKKKYVKSAVPVIEGYAHPVRDPETIENSLEDVKDNLKRDGYVLKGLYLDSKGKKPLPVDVRAFSKKFGSTVTVYAVWEKKK